MTSTSDGWAHAQHGAWRGVAVSVVAFGSPSHRVEAGRSSVLAVVAHGSRVVGESAVGNDLSHFRQYLVSRIEKNPCDNSWLRSFVLDRGAYDTLLARVPWPFDCGRIAAGYKDNPADLPER